MSPRSQEERACRNLKLFVHRALSVNLLFHSSPWGPALVIVPTFFRTGLLIREQLARSMEEGQLEPGFVQGLYLLDGQSVSSLAVRV